MSEEQWDKFVEMLEELVESASKEGVTWQEKAVEVRREFVNRGAETALEEFAAWFE